MATKRRSKLPERFGMNVKFTAAAKRALEKLAETEQRSQQQIITRLLEPVLIDAARDL